MSRDTTLPTGAVTAAVAPSYVARHAVRIATPTPLLLCEGPGSLVIGGETYLESALVIGDVSVAQWPAVTIRVPNDTNQISEPDANGDLVRRAAVLVYEVMWNPSTGAQLDPVQVFSGAVADVRCSTTTAELTCKTVTAGSALMVGRLISRLCHYVFGGARCGLSPEAVLPGVNVIADPTFARASTAYKQDGTSVASGAARYEAAKFGNGVVVEEGTTNLLTVNCASVETNLTGILSNGTLTRDTTTAWSGVASAKVVAIGAGVLAIEMDNAIGAVSPGTTYSFSCWCKIASATITGCYIALIWRNSGGVLLGTSYGSTVVVSTGWCRVTASAAAPANTARLDIQLQAANASTGDSLWYDGGQAESKAYPTSFQLPGSARVAETLTIPPAAVSVAAGTVEAWVKLLRAPGTQVQHVITLDGGANASLRFYVSAAGVLACAYGTGTTTVTITGTTVLASGTLYHVAATWSSAGVAIYLNGTSEGSSATTPGLSAIAAVYLGSNAVAEAQLDGILDEVRIEDNARTATQIAADAASLGAAPPTLHTLYKAALDSSLVHVEGINGVSGCDHRLATCQTFGNSVRFGGWPSLPRIGTKVSYTLTTSQPIAQRIGTVAPAPPAAVAPRVPRPVSTPPGAPRVRPHIGRS